MSNKRNENWRPGRFAPDSARLTVFNVLMAVHEQGAFANIELPKEIRFRRLNKRDAAYATNLCYGTLRLQGRWDAIMRHCTNGRPLAEIDPAVLIVIRMAIHQLLEFGTYAYAAINENVNLTRTVAGTGASGFVNAVLHRVSERSASQWREQLIADAGGSANSVQFLSTWFSHPAWIVRAFDESLKANGRAHKDIVSVLRANNEPANVVLAARDMSVQELEEDIRRGHMRSERGTLVDTSVLLLGGNPGRVFAVQDSRAGVQDEGSQLIARVCANTPVLCSDDVWLDMCAGPGGKTATMAALAAERGIRVHANEIHEHRLDLVDRAVRPWSDIVDLRLGDGCDLGREEPQAYSRVLVDAPCTGIGALRRRPEARWNKEAGDAIDLAHLQAKLLESAWQAVRPGGIVVYSTCSPYLVETRSVVDDFLARTSQAMLLDGAELASAQALKPISGVGGHVQLWPDVHGTDAMYMAVIRKEN